MHLHQKGIHFRKKIAANQRAVELTLSLLKNYPCVAGNGWTTWKDIDRESEDFGLWVAFNHKTRDTYVQSVDNFNNHVDN